jgi:hypothetical protein
LRVLFVVQDGKILRFALLLPALAARGHDLHIAFASGHDWKSAAKAAKGPPPRALELVEELCRRFPNVSYDVAPQRTDADGWRRVAWLVRGLADLGLNAHPRFAGRQPPVRAKKLILGRMKERGEFEPLGLRFALRLAKRVAGQSDAALSRSVIRKAARLEDAIPTSSAIDDYVRALAPDVVLATGTFRFVANEVDYLKSARRLGIPTGIFVASWDNLVNKGALKFVPERVFVWNDVQVRDAVDLHDIPRDRIRATGAHVFDSWFVRRPSQTREEYLARLGLDPSRPFLVYLCSSTLVAPEGEVAFVRRWIEAVRSSSNERLRTMNIVVRPHPGGDEYWSDVDLGFENAAVWPRKGVRPVAEAARVEFFDTLNLSAAVVGINTTAMIEAAVVGKSVLTILLPEFNQESTVHFHFLLAENGGFLHVAKDLEEHVGQLAAVLDEDAVGAERRRRFVESFVRPAGVDRPAATVAAEAIEELAEVPVEARTRLSTLLLRRVLALEAALTVAYRVYRGRRESKKQARRKLELEPRETAG